MVVVSAAITARFIPQIATLEWILPCFNVYFHSRRCPTRNFSRQRSSFGIRACLQILHLQYAKEGPAGKVLNFFPRQSWNAFQMGNSTHGWAHLENYYKKIYIYINQGTFFWFAKRAGKGSPLSVSCASADYRHLISIWRMTMTMTCFILLWIL